MNLKNLAITGTLALCTGAFTLAQDSTTGAGSSSFSSKDKTYLKASAQSDMAEMNMAQLALQKSSNDDIKSYANQMMTDHQQTTNSAKPVAEKAGVPMPTDVDPMQKAQYKKLQGMSGDQFDKAYAQINVMDHKKVLGQGKSEAASTKNSDMKTLTSMQEPIITDHTQKAQALAQKLGVNSNPLPSEKSSM